MRTTVPLGDVVGEGQDIFMVTVVPPERDFDADVVLFADHVDWLFHDGRFGPVEVFHEFLNAAVIVKLCA